PRRQGVQARPRGGGAGGDRLGRTQREPPRQPALRRLGGAARLARGEGRAQHPAARGAAARAAETPAWGGGEMNGEEMDVRVGAGEVTLEGTLGIPEQPRGIVLFAHGSGSSRFSPRNRYVARILRDHGLATLLIDLLTPQEEEIDLVT